MGCMTAFAENRAYMVAVFGESPLSRTFLLSICGEHRFFLERVFRRTTMGRIFLIRDLCISASGGFYVGTPLTVRIALTGH